MTTIVPLPFGVLVATDDTWTLADGTTSIVSDGQLAALYDGDLATGARQQGAHADTGDLTEPLVVGQMPTPLTLPEGFVIASVRLVGTLRIGSALGASRVTFTASTDAETFPEIRLQLPSFIAEDRVIRGPRLAEAAAATPWTPTLLAELKAAIEFAASDGTSPDPPTYSLILAELAAEVEFMSAPAISDPAPASGYVDDLTMFSWQWTGDDAQSAYELKVWTEAVATGMGFDPETTPASLTLTGGSATQVAAFGGSGLTRGAGYRWAVRAAKDLNGAPWWTEFTTPAAVTYNAAPVVTVTDPAGSITTSSSPLVEWTSADAQNGSLQGSWEARIFAEPVGGWPASGLPSGPALASGSGTGNANEWQPSVVLDADGDFRAYVRVRGVQSPTSNRLWSAWAWSDFAIDVDAPAGPTFSAAFTEDRRALLSLTTGPDDPMTTFYEVTRSTDGGATWAPFWIWQQDDDDEWAAVDSARLFFGDAATLHELYDQEVFEGRDVRYRARSIDTSGEGEIASEPTVAVVGVLASTCRIYLADPLVFGPPLELEEQAKWLAGNLSMQATPSRPIGREGAVVQQGTPGGEAFSLGLLFTTEASYVAALDLLASGRTMLLMTERRNWFVRVAGDIAFEYFLWDAQHGDKDAAKLGVPLVRVDDPR